MCMYTCMEYSVCLQVIAAASTQEELLRGEAESTKASTHANANAACVCVLCVLLCSRMYTLACTHLLYISYQESHTAATSDLEAQLAAKDTQISSLQSELSALTVSLHESCLHGCVECKSTCS